MIRFLCAALGLLAASVPLTVPSTASAVENTWDYSVRVSASVQAAPASITLSWPQDTNGVPTSYTVYRKAPADSSWGAGTTLAGSATSYQDTSVTVGAAYEYRVVKVASSYTGYGYVQAGIAVPLIEHRGKLVLIVDSTFTTPLAAELARLEQDLNGDGWTVIRRDVARTASAPEVKALIKSAYDADRANVKAVFLFGHIAVPYSGQFNPDGHPDHIGAWPADVYYGDVDGNWTDSTVNYTQTLNTDKADAARMSNVPGDGKFDQTEIPSQVELQVGRVDLANMPGRVTWGGPATFPTELELLRKYLNKDHNFRHRKTNPPRRALLGDYFGQRGGEAFAASGHRAFAPLVGADNVRNLNTEFNDQKGVWIPQVGQNDYLLVYGCGAGSYKTIAGLGNTGIYNDGSTTEYVAANAHGVFNLLFGSWLGDWDHEDNFLRAPLATDHGLISVWSGRPHWFIHPIGLGETMGYVTRLTQNNVNLYQTQINSAAHRVHVALMGDPTLRLHPVVPVSALTGTVNGSSVALSWTASTDSNLIGYHVYRAASKNGTYTRLTSSPVTATAFTDSSAPAGSVYMVRALKLENTTSGSYQNPAQGVFWSMTGGATTPTPTTPTVDSTAPVVAISSPAASTTVSGAAVAVTANATDNVGVQAVQFKLNGANLGAEVTKAPFATTWNTTTVANGTHTLSATVRDAAGNMATASTLAVTVTNTTSTSGSTSGATSGSSTTTVTGPIAGTGTTGATDTTITTSTLSAGTPGTPAASDATVQISSNDTVWVDDALPTGAYMGSTGGDAWTWVTSAPAPFSGAKAHRSNYSTRLHEHFFSGARTPLSVATGEKLIAYVYLDPANPPAEIMLSWFAGSWEHRAFWGADKIRYGTKNTPSRFNAGALPAAGRWVRLEVAAKDVGLEGQAITGLSFSAYGGRVSWDAAGKNNGTAAPAPTEPAPTEPVPTTGEIAWADDAIPAGAVASGTWNWVTSSPAPYSGTKAHQSALSGTHEHSFNFAATPLQVAAGEKLFAYVFLDPANPPTEIMLSWNNGNWEHRAYWGANQINYGTNGTASRYRVGDLPAAGQWTRLEVPASAVGLEGSSIIGMSFGAYGGRVTWDKSGRAPAGTTTEPTPTEPAPTEPTPTTPPSSGGGGGSSGGGSSGGGSSGGGTSGGGTSGGGSTPTTPTEPAPTTPTEPAPTEPTIADTTWFDDALPAGASGSSSGGDSWNWIASDPSPYSGTKAHQSASAVGLHSHTLNWASAGLSVATGDKLFTYVYIDPANKPAEIMLSWFADNWEHRAFWGEDRINYGVTGTASRYNAGALPAAGQWVRLEVPASAVGLEGKTITGMSFSLHDGRATWDKTGKSGASATPTEPAPTTPSEPTPTDPTTPDDPVVTDPIPTDPTPTDPTIPTIPSEPGEYDDENAIARAPQVGDHRLRVLTPTMLELNRITTKEPDPAQPADWNFVSTTGTFTAPATSEFKVTVNGQTVSVNRIGFRRRVAFAPLNYRDLRIDNALFLELGASVPEGATVEVTNPSGALWPATFTFKSTAGALRFSPVIHVNQEGYVPSMPKKAMVGYYLGNIGELDVNAGAGFKLVHAVTGATVHNGSLTLRRETGFIYSPQPYQKVLEADFSSFTTPGEYQLVVPGLGASVPFLINDGIAMNFTRTYAQGLYHQRCGAECKLPFTRHEHGTCHTTKAEIPSPQSSYSFTYTTIASRNGDAKNEPRHTAPRLVDEASLLYPFVNQGSIDVSLGHHDAGDYSKYMTNSAALAHLLMFTAENIAGAKNLDNLGLPESGDGVSDLMQEAKHEADYIAKMQDADGGFYFLVYPKNRSYENNVAPDQGDTQVVWPKNTAGSAAATAVLAQLGSSPMFKAKYPADAAAYLAKAKLGWQFLMNAIAKYGYDGSYQKLTHYGHNFLHDDELAWAATELFLATGEAQYRDKLMAWFPNPSDPKTFRWGWWRLSESYGNAIRSYAFAARSGRIPAGQLDATYLAKCEEQIKLAGDDIVKWTNQSAYGTSFPEASRHVQSAGWFFSLCQAADAAVAHQLDPKPEYVSALVSNMNYEGGTNPVNVPYVTGIGLKRQQTIVHQWANNDLRTLPMNGIPQGNLQSGYDMLWHYSASGNELSKLSFPSDDTKVTAYYPLYDRWADTWNVSTEFVVTDQARGLMSVVALATQTAAKATAWKPSATATIVVPSGVAEVGVPVTLSLVTSGLDLAGARILWEARDQQPDFGSTFTIAPKNAGAQWVEAEITWPDGRRMYAKGSFAANAAVVNWVDDALPAGAQPAGSEPWTWVTGSPAPMSGTKAHQSTLASGLHEHAFTDASTPLEIGSGDKLFVNVYLDPANMPEEIMLSWNDGSWEHRAYWGADKIGYGAPGTPGRYKAGALPEGGKWVRLEVPASAVGLEGKSVRGMSFSAFGGRVTWDAAGRTTTM